MMASAGRNGEELASASDIRATRRTSVDMVETGQVSISASEARASRYKRRSSTSPIPDIVRRNSPLPPMGLPEDEEDDNYESDGRKRPRGTTHGLDFSYAAPSRRRTSGTSLSGRNDARGYSSFQSLATTIATEEGAPATA